jgi:hypothetical protein
MRQRFVSLLGLKLLAATACADAGPAGEPSRRSTTDGAAQLARDVTSMLG